MLTANWSDHLPPRRLPKPRQQKLRVALRQHKMLGPVPVEDDRSLSCNTDRLDHQKQQQQTRFSHCAMAFVSEEGWWCMGSRKPATKALSSGPEHNVTNQLLPYLTTLARLSFASPAGIIVMHAEESPERARQLSTAPIGVNSVSTSKHMGAPGCSLFLEASNGSVRRPSQAVQRTQGSLPVPMSVEA